MKDCPSDELNLMRTEVDKYVRDLLEDPSSYLGEEQQLHDEFIERWDFRSLAASYGIIMPDPLPESLWTKPTDPTDAVRKALDCVSDLVVEVFPKGLPDASWPSLQMSETAAVKLWISRLKTREPMVSNFHANQYSRLSTDHMKQICDRFQDNSAVKASQMLVVERVLEIEACSLCLL